MSAPGTARSASPDSVFQTLAWLHKQRFKPVALRTRSKAAIDEKFADLTYAPPHDDTWRENNYGVGVVTGPSHSGPVDVDLDCPEAVFFARAFLPNTAAVFGRKTKPESHYLYRLEADAYAKKAFMDPLLKNTIIEIRADGGHQTVMPGSTHEGTGEEIQWSDLPFPDPERVSPEALEFAVKKVAIATLIVRHMWMEGQRNEVCKHISGMFFYLEWPEIDTQSLIQAVMEYTGDTDKTRKLTVATTYKKGAAGGKVTGANTLRSFLGDPRLVDRITDWAGSQSANILQDYNERYAVALFENKFRIVDTNVPPSELPRFMQVEDFANFTMTDTVMLDDKKVPRSKLWLHNPRRRTYESVDFLPGVEDSSPTLNLWTGWAVQPSDHGSCDGWLELLRDVICGGNEELNRWMLHWLASIVREPQDKSLTAPVIIGEEGAGKSLMLTYFGRILGSAYVVVTDERHVHGHFNRHLSNALLLHSEEALYGGDKKHRSIIASLITDNFRMFEQKGVDAKKVRNHIRLVLTSNEAHAAPARHGDRRFTVIDLDKRRLTPQLRDKVLLELRDGGPARLFQHLLDMAYDPAVARTTIKNESSMKLRQLNLGPVEAWWLAALESGQALPDFLQWASKPMTELWPHCVSSPALLMACQIASGSRAKVGPIEFAHKLDKMIGFVRARKQAFFTNPMSDFAPPQVRTLQSKQSVIDNLPPLEQCREAFVRYIGQDVDWPDEIPEGDKPLHERF